MENRNGLIVDLVVDEANGMTERTTAIEMLDALGGNKRITVGADKAYDTRDFVAKCRELDVTPHVAQNEGPRRRSAIDGRTTRQPGYAISQRIRKRVEEIFGWIKTTGGLRKTRFLGIGRTQLAAHLTGAAYNLLRIHRLLVAEAA